METQRMTWLERRAVLLPVLLSTVLLVGTIVACGGDTPVSPTAAHDRELATAESEFGATFNPAETPAVSPDELEGGDETLNPTPATADPDRAVLTELYQTTGGPNWKNSPNWLSERPLDEWFGVMADDQGRVMRLSLTSNNLEGSLPADLGNLSKLEALHLEGNRSKTARYRRNWAIYQNWRLCILDMETDLERLDTAGTGQSIKIGESDPICKQTKWLDTD